jgi:hypothetical protein
MFMRIHTPAAALLAMLALAAPAIAQEKMQEWTPASLKAVLTEMGFTVTQDKPSGSDYVIAVSAPNGQLPINIYGTNCAAKNGTTACPGADFVTGFKIKDERSKQAAVDKLATLPGVHGVASKQGVMAARMEVSVDFSAGMTRDEIKAKITDYQKTADTAFNTLKSAGLLAN